MALYFFPSFVASFKMPTAIPFCRMANACCFVALIAFVRNGDIFKANGGTNFALIPCLNDSEPGMKLLVHLAHRELQGWA